MLHTFLNEHRDEIIARTREEITNRPWPLAPTSDLENGVPRFLEQLSEALASDRDGTEHSERTLKASATLHGRDLLSLGYNVSQVVHDYGDVCQALTEYVMESGTPITAREFHVLNRCLDTAIAEAVTEHARLTAQSERNRETERAGQLAHDVRDLLNTALLAFEALKRGSVAVNGSTGALLGRSLIGLRDLVSSTLADIRLTAHEQRRERIAVATFCQGLALAAMLNADYRGVSFTADPVDPGLYIDVDAQLMGSAVMNLLNNAFKFTPTGGHVVMRTHAHEGRLRIEVEDECGGVPQGARDLFEPFTDRRGVDRTGLGLGLSIARKAVLTHGGEMHHRNAPGRGCTFVIDLPLAPPDGPASSSPA
jgi:signal transduction histidine kinase